MNYRHKETPFEIQSEEDWMKVKNGWWVSYKCNECGEKHVKIINDCTRKNTCYNPSLYMYRKKETPFEIKSEEDWMKVRRLWYVSYKCNECGKKHVKRFTNIKYKNTCLNKIPYCNNETPFEIQSEEDWEKINIGWWVSYKCNECGKKHVKLITNCTRKNTCYNPSLYMYRKKETPFEIKSEEDWMKVKCGWWVSYKCNECGNKHVKSISELKNAKNTCLIRFQYYKKETPFEIQSEEDWKKVKNNWRVSYICNECGERHIKIITNKSNKSNTCFNKISHFKKETPFEIQSEEDWKKVKKGWYVSYICNECGERHVKNVSRTDCKNTCLIKFPYRNIETPFEIKSEEDWKKVKSGWYVSYICNECGERHVKIISDGRRKNTCLNKISYRNIETPFEIKSEEDWKKVKCGWYASYICKECGKKHVKKMNQTTLKNTCYNPSSPVYRNKETPFEIKSEEDWKKVKSQWYVSYICNKCGERHVKLTTKQNRKNTCCRQSNIKYNYQPTYIDQFVFAI